MVARAKKTYYGRMSSWVTFFCLSTLISSKWPDIKLFYAASFPHHFSLKVGVGNVLKVIKVMHILTLKKV